MTSTTWTEISPAPTANNTVIFTTPAILTKVANFAAIFFGMTAQHDSDFRGLDLNGNAMWKR